MTGTAVVASPAGRRWQAARWPIRLLAVFAVLGSLLAFTQTAMAATASDDFNRANGALGASWTKISDGALTISGQAVAGTAAANYSGDLWTASTFGGNQFSQVTTTSTQLTGGQWIAVAVRANSTGQQAYVGLYFWNNGSPDMRLYRRNGGTWTQLGSTYSSGPLAAGSQLQIRAVGSTISLMQNGTTRISVTDTTLTSGAPGIYAYGKGSADNWTGGDVSTYSVGGTVSGLSGSVVLQDNGGDNLTVPANGSFTFATKLASGAAYAVTVKTNPTGQTCTVTNGTGTIASANITSVTVTCTTNAPSTYSVGGTVSGLSGSVVLQDNGGDNLTVAANGSFSFATKLASGAAYAVTVQTQPAGQTCTVASGSGTIASANVTNVAVTCTTNAPSTYSVGGTVSGLSGSVVLQDNGGDNLTVFANGSFSFATKLASGAAYAVTVQTQPAGQTCTVASGSGTIASANVTNVAVSCTANATYSVGGTLSGATGTVILQDNGGDNLTVAANGSFSFATKLASGAAYAVTVQTQPAGQTCTVASGSGTIASANVTNVAVTCTSNATYSVGGTVSGLSGSVVLQDNGGDNLTVAANGSFTFATKLASGASYNVTVQANPTGQTCTTANGTGTIASANITSVTVTCTANAAGSGSDDFNRANGSLGPNWTDASDGGLTITGQQVAGTAGNSYSGDIRTAETYPADQFSQITLTSTQLTGGQWIGAAIRMQNGGQNQYLGIYFWNNGSPDLMLFKRNASNWTQLGTTYNSGPLSAGTTLQVQATGSTISLLQNGVQRISATDTSVATGAPGIMAYGTGKADNWSGGAASAPPPPSTYSVGGTVSGLSGSVVLQDNGGDNLTVAANGSFTFATKLASGASYNVTVQTNPTGHTCTVTNGTGTIGSANVTSVTVSCTANVAGSGSDDFNRADGSLGPNWTDLSSGGLTITGQQVAGTTAGGTTGDIRTAETYPADQFSQITITSTQLTGGQWIGPAIRIQNGGQNQYAGIYFWNNGSPDLMLFKRSAGNWTQLGTTYNSGPLSAGATLQLSATGSRLSLLLNGTVRISATDTTLAVGAPGIMAFGTSQADNWSGGIASAPASYTVGGSVSGLTGSVVLQDNGGDNLTVSANGPFTFATPVTDGGDYAVTVQTNPTGQTCTVTNGTGTVSGANVTNVAVTCAAAGGGGGSTPVTDDFNRADGSLGANWTDVSDGGLTITGQQAAGTAGSGTSGDMRTAETYPADQFSQITVTSTQLTGGQWIGAAVRMQNGGQNQYAGIYFWNNGSPVLMLFKRNAGTWTQLGTTYNSGPLSAGTVLQVQAAGATISLLQNGVQRISATDTSVTTGAPGIMAFGTGQADNWSGGAASNAGGTATYTIGGNLSGATGTVILQDNSGDSLSVTANGPFTFGTPLADGASYSVTVRTNPAGQACTVASGTGTVHAINVTSVVVTCVASGSSTPGSDDFNRADGSLGPDWADASDGGLVISGQQVTGTNANGVSGDIRTAENYQSDQFSQVTLTSTQLTGGQWIGPAVRVQNGGQNAYVGIYNWNNGSPDVMLFARNAGTWTQLGSTYSTGPLSAGTTLKLMVTGSTLSLLVNGTERVAAGDVTLTGGAPGIMAFGAAQADNWSGGPAGFEMHFLSTSSGISSYDIISANDSDGPHVLQVLQPTNPAPGVAHNFLFVLPVEPEEGSQFGNAMSYLQSIDAQDQYNLTIVEPAFGVDPWYADTSNNPDWQYETFMTQELVPWVKQNLSTTGTEQNWLIGFSKSGIGGQDLIFRHPGVFQLAASWDFPADMSSYDQYGTSSAEQYGTNANFQSSYRLTQAFLDSHKGPFTSANRIWIGGYQAFQADMTDYDALLTSEGIAHSTETPWQVTAHRWDSGWVPMALAALEQDSAGLGH